MIDVVYKNLSKKCWTCIPGKITDKGYATKTKGPSYFLEGYVMTNTICNNPQSIATGCARILRTKAKNKSGKGKGKGKEVVAYVGGTLTQGEPTGELIGTLSLSLEGGHWVLNGLDGSVSQFDPTGYTLAFGKVCSVYQ